MDALGPVAVSDEVLPPLLPNPGDGGSVEGWRSAMTAGMFADADPALDLACRWPRLGRRLPET